MRNFKLLIFASIICLVSVSIAWAQGLDTSSDAFPVPDRLYIATGPTSYGGAIATEIVSMSLSAGGGTIFPLSAGSGDHFPAESFFDVFVEIDLPGLGLTNVTLTGPVETRINVGGSDLSTSGLFDTEIVSMSLSGDAGGMPILIRESPTMQSAGLHDVTDIGGGLYHIDSFFDVFTELSVDGGQSWTPSEGATHVESTGAQMGEFNVIVRGTPTLWNQLDQGASGGDGWVDPDTGDQWLPYPQDDPEQDEDTPPNVEDWPTWWNEWWYDDPYDKDRIKVISLSFDYAKTDSQMDGYAIVTVNWSTTDWSINPPPGIDPSAQPPLEDFDPTNPSVAWVGRADADRIILDDANPSGHYATTYQLPIPYNPEWVSIDVRGYNFAINNGQITHECLEDPTVPPDITIEQLDWIGLNTTTPDSTWGRITLDYNQSPGIYYFNLSVDNGTSGPQWVVQDLSIESLGGDQTLMSYLDLGVADGTDVSSVNYGYSITSAPLVPLGVPPTITTAASVPGIAFQIGGEDGEDLGSPSPPNAGAKADASPGATNDPNSGVIPDKDKFVNQPQDPNQCAPGAISNSLKYLQARGKIPATLPTSISQVGTVVGATATGTPASWYLKKKTHYKDHVNTRWIEAPLTVAKVQELVKELKDGQDIEMDLKGHVEVLAGIRLKPDGTVDLDLYDDNQKDDKSDPMHTSPLMADAAGTQYVDGMELERFVIECPKEQTSVSISSFSLNTFDEWLITFEGGNEHASIIPMLPHEWSEYMGLWNNPDLLEDPAIPYPENTFSPPELYVYEGDGEPEFEDPDDGGLVMHWGDPLIPGDQASAWKLKYEPDPDLSNCIITVAVTAPQFGAGGGGGQVNQVSLGLETPPAGSGNIRSWYWNCGPVGSGAPIEWGVPTTITIDTSITGTAAATPVATNYINAPGFNLTNVQWIIVDENATWVGGSTPAPGPGGAPVFMWNYWHWLMVSPKTTLTKALLTKHSQGPIVIDELTDPDVPLFWGWDEISDYHIGPIAADDWECKDDRPVTDFHWWGSFPGWREPYPPCQPKAFHIGIWTDVPAQPGDPESYSHPLELVWEHICEKYVWNFAGYDRDPRSFDPHDPTGGFDPAGNPIPADDPSYEPDDACFQYNQLLDGDDWFYQEPMDDGTPRTYWLSIAPIWDEDCDYQWGWKTRPKFYMDNAVSITAVSDSSGVATWPPVLGSLWNAGVPLQIPPYPPHGDAISWDLAFEISTNEKAYEDDPIPGDIGGPGGALIPDGRVTLDDFRIMALHWLEIAP